MRQTRNQTSRLDTTPGPTSARIRSRSTISASDANGDKAKTLLKRLIVLTVKSQDAANTWQSAILGL